MAQTAARHAGSLEGMRNPEKEAKPVSVSAEGFRARKNSIGSAEFTTQGVIPVIRWDNKNSDEKIVPAREHSRLTHRELETTEMTGAARDRAFCALERSNKENRDAL
jgi:hypothetical protein